MAGDWIKMTVHLDTDPSVIQIAEAAGMDELGVVGRLWKVWAWADQHSVDGNAVRVTSSFLDKITNCPGFAKAMRDAGWLEGRDGALTFPHFDRHNGHPAKKRALTKDRVKEHRNASRVTHALLEKRRVEKKRIPPAPKGEDGGGEAISDLNSGKAKRKLADELYALYPRKISGRSRAIEAICGALRRTDGETLRLAIKRYAATPDLRRENGRFVASPINWFREDCWKDHLPKATGPAPEPIVVPSEALEGLRTVLRLNRPRGLSDVEESLARKYLASLTLHDHTLLTLEESVRCAQLLPNQPLCPTNP